MPKPFVAALTPSVDRFEPSPKNSMEAVQLDLAEIEALRLIDLEKLSFEEAGTRMKVSRNTVWRLVESAREKLVRAILEGKGIIIQR
jgi:predicted DNA-binding protein (UPF0251 family)